MKALNFLFIILLIPLFNACKDKEEVPQQSISERVLNLEPTVDFKTMETDFKSWWTYYSNHTPLSLNFIPIDEQFDTIGKRLFLEKLSTGNFIPLKIQSNQENDAYQLFKLGTEADKSIKTTIKNQALINLKHYNMEGRPFPEFKFTDLNGTNYTNENINGKTLIIKTWFIHCKACIAEFSELNDFIERHQQNEDVIFLSLALDSKTDLEKFLMENKFEYQVVSDQRHFIEDKLNLNMYPTHLIIDKSGTITKVVNKASDMMAFFENSKAEESPKKMLPPAPPM